MPKRMILPAFAILAAVFASSCKDDPELVRKRDQQRTEIRRLEGQLSLLQEQLKDAPSDRSGELRDLQSRVESEQEQIALLEKEVADLASEKRRLDREFEDYKQKYRLR